MWRSVERLIRSRAIVLGGLRRRAEATHSVFSLCSFSHPGSVIHPRSLLLPNDCPVAERRCRRSNLIVTITTTTTHTHLQCVSLECFCASAPACLRPSCLGREKMSLQLGGGLTTTVTRRLFVQILLPEHLKIAVTPRGDSTRLKWRRGCSVPGEEEHELS